MRIRPIQAGRLLGIPLLIHPSWFLIVIVITTLLGTQIYPDLLEHREWPVYAAMAVLSSLLFFGSVVVHELAHSIVARAFGIPVRSITLFVLGGVANIAREPKRPMPDLLMAAAGPLTSLAIGAGLLGLWLLHPERPGPLDVMLFWLGFINVVLAISNLIPAFPLDGARVFRSLIWLLTGSYVRATAVSAWTGRVLAWVVMATGIVTVLGYDVVVAEPGLGGIWLLFIGFFLESSSRHSLFQGRVVNLLDGYRADQLMTTDPPVVDAEMTVASLARGVIEINPRVCYFVEDAGKLAGIISAYQMRAVPEAKWDTTTAGEAMVPSTRLHAVAPGNSATDVLLEMENGNFTHLPVVSEGRVVGVVGRDRIILLLKHEGFLGRT